MNFKKLSMTALSVASLAGILAIPSQVLAGADSSTGDILGIAGSDTTFFVMNALVDAHNINPRYNPNQDKAVNIAPLVGANANVESGEATLATSSWLKAARLAWPGGVVLPADSNCTTQYVFGGAGSVDTAQDGDTNGTVSPDVDIPFTAVSTVPGGPSGATYTVNLGVVPPNGSGDGRNAVKGLAVKGVTYNSVGNDFACLDIARSSSYPTSADVPSKLEAWAFGLDAIAWTYFPGNSHPAISSGLTTTQTNQIYQCATANVDNSSPADGDFVDVGDQRNGFPKYRYWGDISGDRSDTTPIVAYRVQAGSGTGKDIASVFMGRTDGIDSQVLAGCDSSTNNTDGDMSTSWTFPIVQEHDCRNVSDVSKPNAICWYGYSRWVLQARSLETDKRNGAIFGKSGTSSENVQRPSFSSINESATRFHGTRYVYNVIPQNSSVDVARSSDARRFVGVSKQSTTCVTAAGSGTTINEATMLTPEDCNFDGDTTDTAVALGAVPGFVCGDAVARRIIASFGFKPLPLGTTSATISAYGTSYCRLNKSSL